VTWAGVVGLAVKGVSRRPGRAVLTVLAVALAAALLTALLTIAGTAENRVLNELAKGGPLSGIKVAAATPNPAQIGEDDAQPGAPKDLDQAAVDRIRGLPSVRDVIPVVSAKFLVVPPRLADPAIRVVPPFVDTVVGVDVTQSPNLPITVVQGRLPAPGASTEVAVTPGYLSRYGLQRTDAPAVLGSTIEFGAAQNHVVGEQVSVRGRWFKATIVGVVAQEASDGQFLVSSELVDQARQWSAQGTSDARFGMTTTPYTGAFVIADTLDDVGKVRTEIVAVGYSTSAPENLIASVLRYLHVVEIVLTAVGAIALIVAALGITNAMLAAVRERRREIGVLKAIGGRDRDVLRVFLVEAGVLGLIGGVLGALVGWLIARVVGGIVNSYLIEQGLTPVELMLPLNIILGTIAGATVLAIVAGTLPAARAARLPAREAVDAL
jgi:putative ABC transport system permease protein